MYAAKAPMASFATRKGASPRFNSRAIAPLPSLAICKRIQRIVNCASSQFMANRRRLLESAFKRWGSLTCQTLLNYGSLLRQNLRTAWSGGSVATGGNETRYRCLKETSNQTTVPKSEADV